MRESVGLPRAVVELLTIMLGRFKLLARIWLIFLMIVNASSLLFIHTTEGQVVFSIFLLSALGVALIYKELGFVRLLGLGHLLWVPMLVWLAGRLPHLAAGTSLETWLFLLCVTNTISLILDAVDVTRYIRGERQPYHRL
jgi:hypothetical protein